MAIFGMGIGSSFLLALILGPVIAAAAGVRSLGQSRAGRSRGVFCGMGVCQDCLVRIDGRLSQRACMTEAAEGMKRYLDRLRGA